MWNNIVEVCNDTDLSPMDVSFVLRRIAFTIECYCEGEAKAEEKIDGSDVEKASI